MGAYFGIRKMNTTTETYTRFIQRSNALYNNKLTVKQHQVDGVNWLVKNEQFGGGFLCDDMGLGKTLMMIMTCLVRFRTRTLIVLPSAILYQWHSEFKRITGHDCLVFHGPKRKRISMNVLLNAPFVLTTYHCLSRKKADIIAGNKSTCLLHDVVWDRVVFDEAHHLRNKNCMFYGAQTLRKTVSWFISGTPIQNRLSDFSNLCSVHMIDKRNVPILRRSKADVGIDLIPAEYHNVDVDWNNTEELALAKQAHFDMRNAHTIENYIVAMQLCKQSCIYPKLLKKNMKHLSRNFIPDENNEDDDLVSADFERVVWDQHSKLDAVVDVLYQRRSNQAGKIVFCHYKAEMEYLKQALLAKNMTVTCFDSSYTPEKRDGVLRGGFLPIGHSIRDLPPELSRHINSFLLSDVTILQIRSSCEGLNLQNKYAEVYFVGPCWNPSVENQAIARCHRIGQKKKVHVFRFYMKEFPDDDLDVKNMDQYILRTQHNKIKMIDHFYQKTNI